MKMIFNVLAITFLLFLSCTTEEVDGNPDDPRNLVVEFLKFDDGSGTVTISATAEKAVRYEFEVGESGVDLASNVTGTHQHTYKETGIYTVVVKAIGSNDRFLKHTEQITVQLGTTGSALPGYETPLEYNNMNLVWSDEFNGDRLNQDYWSYDIGTGCPDLCGWGNNELEYYRAENSWVANGLLTIEARKENFQNSEYTSTKVVTRDKQTFRYGRIDVRAKLPKGQGIWPAFWLLGQNQTSVGWPKCGEIDLMEMIGGSGRERESIGNVFWDNNGVVDQPSKYVLPEGRFYDEYHVFSIIWTDEEIKWLVDDNEFKTFDIKPTTRDEFTKPFYFIMNVAVGGNLPGNPNASTEFPTQMNVDYVRYFQFN